MNAEYAGAWRRFRRLRNAELAVFIGGGALDLFLPPLYESLTNTADDSKLSIVLFLIWAIASVVVGARLMKWKCPRCGKIFSGGAKAMDSFRTWFNWVFLPEQCVNCELARYATSADSPPRGD